MTVRIDTDLCDGCTERLEGFCEEICPGDLFYCENGTARLREPAECWDCFACVKACPREALCIELPVQISESLHRLSAHIKTGHILWEMHDRQGNLINQCTIPNRVLNNNCKKEKKR